ncbi:MAG TPA: hypothetical protein VF476_10985 [Chitinophagaceae bacterium]
MLQPIPINIKLTQELAALSKEEMIILHRIKRKKLLFIGTTYISLVVLLPLSLIYGWGKSYRYSEKIQETYWSVAPFGGLFFFIVLSVYFLKYYRKSVHPFLKDIKNKKKILLYFTPEVYKTPFFEEYFLQTEIEKRKRIRIGREMYQRINSDSLCCIHMAPQSQFIFQLSLDGETIAFSEKNESDTR